MDVGFIGLGNMGGAIARNLLTAGHRLTVHNRTRDKAEALAAEGARVAARPADAWRNPLVITMLADDAAVESVVFGDGGGISTLGHGAIHVSMSTISVALSDRLAEAHRHRRPGLCRRAGVRPAGGRRGGQALHRRRGRGTRDQPLPADVRRDRPADVRHRRQAFGGQSRQAQRQFPDRVDDRKPRRGVCARPQGRRRSARLSRDRDRNAVLGAGLQDLRRAHRQ